MSEYFQAVGVERIRAQMVDNVPCLTSRNERECKVSYYCCTSLAVTAPGVRLVLLCLPRLVLYTLGVDRDIYRWSLDMGMYMYMYSNNQSYKHELHNNIKRGI